jgi:hypothetical protein
MTQARGAVPRACLLLQERQKEATMKSREALNPLSTHHGGGIEAVLRVGPDLGDD